MLASIARRPMSRLAVLAVVALTACTPMSPPIERGPGPTANPIGSSGGYPGGGSGGSSGGYTGGGNGGGGGQGGLVNGDFETGDLTGWTTAGPVSITTQAEAGRYAAQVGASGPAAGAGASTLTQRFFMPYDALWISFQVQPDCESGGLDLDSATLSDGRQVIDLYGPVCDAHGNWLPASADVSIFRGETVTLNFAAFAGAAGDVVSMRVDQVAISEEGDQPGPSCGGDDDCDSGESCDNVCEPQPAPVVGCTTDSDCGGYEECDTGICEPPVPPSDPDSCDSDADCDGGVCDAGTCSDASGDGSCDPSSQSCDGGGSISSGSGDDGSGSGDDGSGDGSGDDGSGGGISSGGDDGSGGASSGGDGSGDDGSDDGDDGSDDDKRVRYHKERKTPAKKGGADAGSGAE